MDDQQKLTPPRAELDVIDEELSLSSIDRAYEAQFNQVLDDIDKLKIDYQSMTLARHHFNHGKSQRSY